MWDCVVTCGYMASPYPDWDEKTPPESLSAMRGSIEANTVTSNSALEWSIKTYELVKPTTELVAAAHRNARMSLVASSLALLVAFVALACEAMR